MALHKPSEAPPVEDRPKLEFSKLKHFLGALVVIVPHYERINWKYPLTEKGKDNWEMIVSLLPVQEHKAFADNGEPLVFEPGKTYTASASSFRIRQALKDVGNEPILARLIKKPNDSGQATWDLGEPTVEEYELAQNILSDVELPVIEAPKNEPPKETEASPVQVPWDK